MAAHPTPISISTSLGTSGRGKRTRKRDEKLTAVNYGHIDTALPPPYAQLLAAQRIGIGIGPRGSGIEEHMRDGTDRVGGRAINATGTQGRVVVGQITCVGAIRGW